MQERHGEVRLMLSDTDLVQAAQLGTLLPEDAAVLALHRERMDSQYKLARATYRRVDTMYLTSFVAMVVW